MTTNIIIVVFIYQMVPAINVVAIYYETALIFSIKAFGRAFNISINFNYIL